MWRPGCSPYAGRHYPTRPLFGDENVHTGWSGDACMSGATLGPEDAFRFACGEEVVSTRGQPALDVTFAAGRAKCTLDLSLTGVPPKLGRAVERDNLACALH